jgi:hypothetical protein
MGSRYQVLSWTTAAGTTIAAPLRTIWPLDTGILTRLEIMIPSGHNGLTGIRILRSQQQVIPWANSQFLVANGETIGIDYGEELTEGFLDIRTYNTDIYDHTFYSRATMTDLPDASAAGGLSAPIIATALLTSAGVPSS